MDQAPSPANGFRRNEDIALDLLKFVASITGTGRAASPSAGFVAAAASKSEDQADQLLDLYAKCLRTIQGMQDK